MTRTAVRLSAFAGVVTWLAIGILPLTDLLNHGLGSLLEPAWAVYWLTYLGFGVVFIAHTGGFLGGWFERFPLVPLAFQVAAASAALVAVPEYSLTGILFIITASQAAHVIGLRPGLGLVVGQSALLGVVAFGISDEPSSALVQVLIYFGFQVFALMTTQAALNEAAARADLAQANAELRATQKLLSDSSRMAERVRIARELHDLTGHHLTALALNLEVANHLATGEAHEHVGKAQAIAKLLLGDVRAVVSTLREEGRLDVVAALNELVAAVPRPAIHLSMPADLRVSDPGRAQVLVRCVQEVITNTVRHADAANLWLVISLDRHGLTIEAHDDGRGAIQVQAGNGLVGMRERLEQVGGSLAVEARPGRGFQLNAHLPAS